MSICVCRYPLVISDSRNDVPIEFYAMPVEVLNTSDLPLPEISRVELNDKEGRPVAYYAVQWRELNHDNVKEYDVNGHIVIAGCDFSDLSDVDGQLACVHKSLYIVLHPEEEWLRYHVIDLDGK